MAALNSVVVSPELQEKVPGFKIGIITYNNIVVDESPQMLRGRLDYFQEEMTLQLEDKSYADIPGLAEWRRTFKALGTDPSRYRPSAEALYRRVKKGNKLPAIHSAADMNNYFSIKYEIPLGIYDLDQINSQIEVRVGTESDSYEGINGREMNMEGKLIAADQTGAFGSPIVDSKRTMTTERTKNALQIVYLKPSMGKKEAQDLIAGIGEVFEQIHGGTNETAVIHE
ncbi:MAG TPA: phenylalanine--tRNA ligase beta subunit-related protein [Bacillales bacterium]|nr:phenylalanine--tRNA ligase beta subunit-related protein [Bacillales bacterium]